MQRGPRVRRQGRGLSVRRSALGMANPGRRVRTVGEPAACVRERIRRADHRQSLRPSITEAAVAGSVVSRTMSSRSAFLRGSSVHDRPLFQGAFSGVVERPGRSPAPRSVGGNGSSVVAGLRSPRVAQDMQTIGGAAGNGAEVRAGYPRGRRLAPAPVGSATHAGGPLPPRMRCRPAPSEARCRGRPPDRRNSRAEQGETADHDQQDVRCCAR